MKTSLLLAAAISTALAQPLVAAPTTRPSRELAPTTQPAAQQVGPDVQLRSLPSVLDARERRLDWHAVAQQAAERVQVDVLKQQLIQRLSGLVPKVANELAAHPQQDALVTVAVYKQPADGKQSLVAVTFDGLGDSLDSRFYGNVLADWPAAPKAQGIPDGLVLDQQATSYLIFFLGSRGLQAGDIPHAKMKQDILMAAKRDQQKLAREDAVATRAPTETHQQDLSEAQPAAAPQPAGGVAYADPYSDYSDDGYYYPGIGVPIVILPLENWDTRAERRRFRHREEELERQHEARERDRHHPEQGIDIPPGSQGEVIPPGSQGEVIPPGGEGIVIPPGSQGQVIPPGSQGQRSSPGTSGSAPPARRAPAPRQAPPPHQHPAPAPRETPAPRQAPPAAREAPPAPPPRR